MPRFRKRNTAVYAALLGSAVYILYSLLHTSRSSGECEPSTEHRRIVTGLDNDFGLGTKSRLSWGNELPETTVVTESPGYAVFDSLYAYKGNYVVVSDDQSMHTITKFAISDGQPRFRVLDGFHAKHELGPSGIVLPGTTVRKDTKGSLNYHISPMINQIIFNDPPGPEGYLIYPGNFVGEALLGAWKTLAICPPPKELHNVNNTMGYHPHQRHHTATKHADLPVRYIFPKCGKAGTWQDPDGTNAWYLTHLNPYAAIEEQGAWQARAKAGEAFVFERAIIMSAAIAKSRNEHTDILEPWRASFFESVGVEVEPAEHPVVVYVDHQMAGRRLLQHEHEGLIHALKGLTGIAEVHVANIREMTMKEKLKLFGKTTVSPKSSQGFSLDSRFTPIRKLYAILDLVVCL
ncbi:hypothetical protein QFC22_001087 [Naganishia vaughanmartiniae]|uniref:Uncharacterized protein n=1 Tax=Naganishia vaughanmartiniae TaxID=1424756 RepID=A0ACC2XM03_9TREE|nr:hypothetical protein QFC22_001087 [Naganishia vaughanmartiniae]